MSKPLRIRRLREQMAAMYQYAQDLYSPIENGDRDAPVIVLDCFDGLLETLDEFDRQLAKIDGRPGAVGGEVRLVEEWSA
jgi:hypothetical protein